MSGKLDRTEYAAMCTEMGWDTSGMLAYLGSAIPTAPHQCMQCADSCEQLADIDASMKYLDTDGDGEISFNEFLTWCAIR